MWSLMTLDEHQGFKSTTLTEGCSVSSLPTKVQHNTFVEII